MGHVCRNTTNPDVATGDGVAMAYRAGAEIQDIEFVQFHPTALHLEGAPSFLLSEALRGEGAQLRNAAGERFMERYHPLQELAPRDVVARAIVSEMQATGARHVFLDLSHREPGFVRARFPRIYETCWRYGIDLEKQAAPVAPAAHYAMGGVRTDLDGRASLPGLYAAGEAACTGVHAANRLASNSLLEALVFGALAARTMLDATGPQTRGGVRGDAPGTMTARGAGTRVNALRDRPQRRGSAASDGAAGGDGAGRRGAQRPSGGGADREMRAGTRGEPRGTLSTDFPQKSEAARHTVVDRSGVRFR